MLKRTFIMIKLYQIYWVFVPYEEDPTQGKYRPVIFMNSKDFTQAYYITSQSKYKDEEYSYPIQKWSQIGLKKPSWILFNTPIINISPQDLKYIGRLDEEDIEWACKMYERYKYLVESSYKDNNKGTMKLTQYQKSILEQFLKNKKASKLFENNKFNEIDRIINPVFWFELIEIFKSCNIVLPENIIKEHNKIKNDKIELYNTPFIDKDPYGFYFSYNTNDGGEDIHQLCALIKFLRLMGEDKLLGHKIHPDQIKENLFCVYGFELRFAVNILEYNDYSENDLQDLRTYPPLYMELISNYSGEVLYQISYNDINEKKKYYEYNDYKEIYEVDEDKFIDYLNEKIDKLNEI